MESDGKMRTIFETAVGRDVVGEAKRTLKQKAVHEVREYLIMSTYLFLVFSLLVVYKSVVLAEYHIDFALHGFALINALALAKIMLVAQNLHLAEQLNDAPLFYPALAKSFVFSILLACFKIAEDSTLGVLRGKSFHQSIADLGGGSWWAIACLTVLLFVMLIPFFGFTELRRVFGGERLMKLFFRSRLIDLPSADPKNAFDRSSRTGTSF